MALDILDFKAVDCLMQQARMTWAELATSLGLSGPAAADRVRRLEEKGVIRGYAALVDPESVDCGLAAFIAVTLERPMHRQPFLDRVLSLPSVLECHHIAGDGDYLLKIRCAHTRALEQLIDEVIKGLEGVVHTRTTVVLSTAKETPVLPLHLE